MCWIKNAELDRTKWNAMIQNATDPQIGLAAEYLDEVTPDWNAIVLDDYALGMPVPIKEFMGVEYAVQPAFLQQGGFMGSKTLSAEIIDQAMEMMRARLAFFELHMCASHPSIAKSNSYFKRTFYLDLHRPYSSIREGYSQCLALNLKRNCMKCTVRPVEMHEALEHFMEHSFSRIQGLRSYQTELLSDLLYKLQRQGITKAIGCFAEGEMISSAVFLFGEKKIQYFLGALDRKHRRFNGPSILLDSIIRKYAAQDKVLDFEGSMHEGVAHFYRQFGGDEIFIPCVVHHGSFVTRLGVKMKRALF